MPTPHVSLQDVLSAAGGPLEERALWALLRQAAITLKKEISETDREPPRLLITPESMLLYLGGAVQFLPGLPDDSVFMAPELVADKTSVAGGSAVEKSYVYSLGMTMFAAMQNGLEGGQLPLVSDNLHQLLVGMIEDSSEQRSSLALIASLSQQCSGQAEMEHVDRLVTYVLGNSHELSSDDCGDVDDADLESQLQEAMNMRPSGSREHLYSPSYGSRTSSSQSLASKGSQGVQRNASFHSMGDSQENITSTPLSSSLPPLYFTRSQDRLNMQRPALVHPRNHRWSSYERLMLQIQPQDLDILASKGKRQLPPDPSAYGSHLYTPVQSKRPDPIPRPLATDVRRSASFSNPPSAPHSAGLVGISFFRTGSDESPHGTEFDLLPPRLPPPPPPPQTDVEDVSNPPPVVEIKTMNEVPLEAWVMPDLTALEEGAHHEEGDRPSDTQTETNDLPITSLILDDMPSLPPRPPPPLLASDDDEVGEGEEGEEQSGLKDAPAVAIPSVQKIDSILQSVEIMRDSTDQDSLQPLGKHETDGTSDGTAPFPKTEEKQHVLPGSGPPSPPPSRPPPPLPTTEPPMFTPFRREEEAVSEKAHDATFDYSEMGGAARDTESRREDEFEFPVIESPPSPPPALPPLLSYEPPEDSEGLTPPSSPPPLPPSSPPQLNYLTVEEVATIAETYPQENVPFSSVSLTKDGAPERSLTPRRALDEAFEQLEAEEALHQLETSEDQSAVVASELYAKVKKPRTATWPREKGVLDEQQPPAKVGEEDMQLQREGEKREEEQQPASELSAKVEKKARSSVGEVDELAVRDVVWKASSADDVMNVHYAEVHDPKRSSMPPGSIPAVEFSPIPSASISPSISSLAPPLPPRPPGSVFDVTYDEDWQKLHESDASLHKLQKVFGPEFAHLSGGQKKLAEPKATPVQSEAVIPEGRKLVRVVLLNGRSVDFTVEHDSYGQDLFRQVVSYQSLWERHVFGLAVIKNRHEIFLDLDCKLAKYAPSNWTTMSSASPSFTVFFRVKYYVENVAHLKLPQTRHQYYLQLRKDLLEGKMYCHEETALKLAALALQAEKGDYDTQEKPHDYFRPEDYLSEKVMVKLTRQYVHDHLPNMHSVQFGVPREAAELNFLKEAQKLPEYGNVFYRVAKGKHEEEGKVWLGFCVRGIVVYNVHRDVKTPLHHCPWRKTKNISFANRKFIIEMQDSKPLTFYTSSYKRARYLLHLSISYHRFQLYTRGLLSQDHPELIPDPQIGLESPTKGSFTPSSPTGVVHEVRLLKEPGKGLGIRIADQTYKGGSRVVVEDVMVGGAAHIDGKLKTGDVLLSLDGHGLEGMGHKEVAELLANSPSVITFTLRREGVGSPVSMSADVSTVTEVVVEQPPPVPPLSMKRDSTSLRSPPSRPILSPTPLEMLTVRVQRGKSGNFGFAITGSSQDTAVSVVVHQVKAGGPGEGRVVVGDRIISVNGTSTEGKGYSEVRSLLQSSSEELQLEILRRATPTSFSHLKGLPDGNGFVVEVAKYRGALGLQIAGGRDKPFGAGFIRIKQLSEGSPAAQCGRLREGDILLEVNGESLIGVTHHHAADILLQSGERVCLHVHHPYNEEWLMEGGDGSELLLVSEEPEDSEPPAIIVQSYDDQEEPPEEMEKPCEEPEKPSGEEEDSIKQTEAISGIPLADDVTSPAVPASPPPPTSSLLSFPEDSVDPLSSTSEPDLLPHVEEGLLPEAKSEPNIPEALKQLTHLHPPQEEVFTLSLRKSFRGLGFTIDKSRSGQKGQGLYVHSVDYDPAKSDGQLRQNDEILKVNGVSLVSQQHKEGVSVLRQARGMVTLTIRRTRTQSSAAEDSTSEKATSSQSSRQQEEEETSSHTEGGVQPTPHTPHQPAPPPQSSPPSSPPPSPPPSPPGKPPPDLSPATEVPEHGGEVEPPPPASRYPFTNLPSEEETQDSGPQLSSDWPVPPDDLSGVVLELEALPVSDPPSDLHLPGDQGDKEARGEEEGEHEKQPSPPLPLSEPPLHLAPFPTSELPPDMHLPGDHIDTGGEEEGEHQKLPTPPLPMSEPPPDLLEVESHPSLPTSEPPADLHLPEQDDGELRGKEVGEHQPTPPLPMSEPPPDLLEVESHPSLPTSEPPADLHLPEQDDGELRGKEVGEHQPTPPLPMSEPPPDLESSPPLPTSEPPADLHLPEQDDGELRGAEEEGEHEKQHSPLPPTDLPEETKLPPQRKRDRPTLPPIKLPSSSQAVADQRPSSPPLGEVMYKVMTNTMYM